MQKARRHRINRLRPLVGAWFQVLFHSPHRGTFHRSLTVLSTIGLTGVFSLTGWSRLIHTEFLVLRATQDNAMLRKASNTQLSCSMAVLSSTFFSPYFMQRRGPTTPVRPEPHRFGLFPVRSPLLGESLICFLFLRVLRCFSSPRLPPHQRMTGLQPAGLSHSEIRGSMVICTYPRLIAAYHVLHRL